MWCNVNFVSVFTALNNTKKQRKFNITPYGEIFLLVNLHFYKTYLNDFMLDLESRALGKYIGDLYMGCPTMADDLLFLSSSDTELQLMFSLAFINSQEKRYIIHPQKSTAQRRCVTSAVRKDEVIDSWQLGSKEVQVEPKLTHLGLLRAEKAESTVNIVERISVARRTLYALIKTGVHGTNGLNPRISYWIYQVYVIPRLLYSLDVLPLTDTHISQLKRFHTSTLRRLQSLPERTASSIVHLLLGALLIQAELHKRQLSLLHSIARSENSRIKCLMGRQLTLQCQKSFFCKAEKILEMYDLPRSAELHNYSKLAWKKLTRQAVNRYWTQALISEARTKSTLANCDVTTLAIENTHIVWETASNNVHNVRRSIPKVRMLAGVFMLQTNKARFNQYKVEATCPLCRLEPEDLSHTVVAAFYLS